MKKKEKEHLLFLVELIKTITKMTEETSQKIYGNTKNKCLENVIKSLEEEIVKL